MKFYYLALSIALTLTLSACSLKEPITPQYESYIGLWESDTYVIEIYANGGGIFDSNRLWDPSRIEGRVRFKEDRIVFISMRDDQGGRRALSIDTPPSERVDPISGETIHYMVLEGVELIKIR
jgi:hypothetical protein